VRARDGARFNHVAGRSRAGLRHVVRIAPGPARRLADDGLEQAALSRREAVADRLLAEQRRQVERRQVAVRADRPQGGLLVALAAGLVLALGNLLAGLAGRPDVGPHAAGLVLPGELLQDAEEAAADVDLNVVVRRAAPLGAVLDAGVVI